MLSEWKEGAQTIKFRHVETSADLPDFVWNAKL